MERVIPPKGMSTEVFAASVGQFIEACQARLTGPGHEQYASDEGQAFEEMGVLEIIEWAREEVQDVANYAAMLDIQLSRLAQRLSSLEHLR